MADMQEMEITIDKDGNVTLKVVGGAEGPACLKLTKDIEEALGVVDKRELTEDYYQEETQAEEHVERQGE